MSGRLRHPIVFLILLLVAVALAGFAPTERVLGASVRVVYLHGAWVWASLLTYLAAAGAGLAAFVLRRSGLHLWSVGLGRSATLFWLTSLFLSLAAMQTNWNGLYLSEPRWILGVRFGLAAVLCQAAVTLIHRPAVGSIVNIIFPAALAVALAVAPSVMHPSSPIFTSASVAIRLFFLTLLAVVLAAALWLARELRPHA
jgi:hypothetical protein